MPNFHLSLKACRECFSIKHGVFEKSLKLSAVLHIFYSLVKPITLYGSEVWSAYKSCFNNKSIDELSKMSLKIIANLIKCT